MKRKWYLRKRMILVLLLLLWWGISRLEFLKLRYQPEVLSATLQAAGQPKPTFATLAVGKKNIHYVQVGKVDTLPAIVLIHGSPGSLDAYGPYLADTVLSRQANLVSIDRPGFGYSDFGKTETSLAGQAEQIAAVLATLPPTPKILVGHSMGGPVITKLAMNYPELVDGLLLVAPSISPALEPSNTWRKIINWIPLRWLTPPAFRVCNQEIIPLKEELEWMMTDWEKLKIPVTVVQGSEDRLVPAGNADFAQKMLTQSSQVKIHKLVGGDHFILWSEVPLVKEAMLDLLVQTR